MTSLPNRHKLASMPERSRLVFRAQSRAFRRRISSTLYASHRCHQGNPYGAVI